MVSIPFLFIILFFTFFNFVVSKRCGKGTRRKEKIDYCFSISSGIRHRFPA